MDLQGYSAYSKEGEPSTDARNDQLSARDRERPVQLI